MALIRNIFWLAIFLGATFLFTVIFEHGPNNIKEDSRTEWDNLQTLWGKKVEKKKDDSDRLTPPLH